eukprot:5315742-Pyramimonas_sp.AAC.1
MHFPDSFSRRGSLGLAGPRVAAMSCTTWLRISLPRRPPACLATSGCGKWGQGRPSECCSTQL